MVLDLKTTTRPNRNIESFRLARTLLSRQGGSIPVEVLEVGPGLAVKYFGRFADQRYPAWDIVRRIESGIRRIPMPDACYESYETRELLRSLEDLRVRVTILDINPRVVRIVKAINPGEPIEVVVADLGADPPVGHAALVGRFDLVVAKAVIVRIPAGRRDVALRNLLGLVAPGGFLLSDLGDCPDGFERVPDAPGFLRRFG